MTHDPALARSNAQFISRQLEGVEFNPNPQLVPLRPVILPHSVRTSLDDATKFLTALIHRVCWDLTDDPVELAALLGLRPEQVPLLEAGGRHHEISYSACNGRLDLLLQGGKPVFLEANFSAANVGPVATHFQLAAYRQLYGVEPLVNESCAGEPFEARARFYMKLLRERNASPSVVIVGQTDERSSGDHRYFAAEASFLRERGFRSSFVDPAAMAELRGKARYSIAMKHFLSEYWRPLGVPLEAMAAAHSETFFFVPDSGRSLSSKLVFAWLSEGTVPLTPSESSFVRQHIPWTRVVRDGEVEFEGSAWRLRDLALARQESFVLKPLTCCGGTGVTIGMTESPEQWKRLVDEAIASGGFIVQEFVANDKLTMDFFDTLHNAVRSLEVSHVFGAYIVDGVGAGVTVRHFPDHGPAVVNVDLGASLNVVI